MTKLTQQALKSLTELNSGGRTMSESHKQLNKVIKAALAAPPDVEGEDMSRAERIEAALRLMADDTMHAAYETLEYGPGGTAEELAAEKLINERRENAILALAAPPDVEDWQAKATSLGVQCRCLKSLIAKAAGWQEFPYMMPGEDSSWCPPGERVHVSTIQPLPDIESLMQSVTVERDHLRTVIHATIAERDQLRTENERLRSQLTDRNTCEDCDQPLFDASRGPEPFPLCSSCAAKLRAKLKEAGRQVAAQESVRAITPELLRNCVTEIEGYGHFREGMDGFMALRLLKRGADELAGATERAERAEQQLADATERAAVLEQMLNAAHVRHNDAISERAALREQLAEAGRAWHSWDFNRGDTLNALADELDKLPKPEADA